MAARWIASITTDTPATGDAVGCPVSGQVASAATPSTPSSARSALDSPPRPRSSGRNSRAVAQITPSRTSITAPNVLPSTSRRSPTRTSNRLVPIEYGTWSQTAIRVLNVTRPMPVQITLAGPRRLSRCGHSSASTSDGPTRSTRPAYPRYLPTGIRPRTTGSTLVSSIVALGGVDAAPTE